MKNFLLRYVAVMLIVFLPLALSAQTTHQVAEGTDGIKAALAGAAAGDIIELTTSGGVYLENDSLVIDKGVTIRAAAGLAEQPVIRSKARIMFNITADLGIADDWWLKLEGIHMDALLIEGIDTTYVGGLLIQVDGGATYYSLKIEGCTLSNLQNKIMWPGADTYCDSAIYSNNIFQHGLVKNCDGLFFRNAGTVGYVLMENSTFWDAGGMFIDVRDGENTTIGEIVVPEVIFQNITVAGNSQPWPMGIIRGKVTVKNLIISNRAYGYSSGGWFKLRGVEAPGALASHILQDSTNQGKGFGQLNDSLAVLDSTTWQWNVDPMFDDPLNGSFNLQEGSPAIGAADDGGNLGDPRWGVVPRVAVDNKISTTPTKFSLEQNYPNPFNPETTIKYAIQKSGHVSLNVYNSLGQQVATLVNQPMKAGGPHHAIWNASSSPSGIYFYKLLVDGKAQVRKMILMK